MTFQMFKTIFFFQLHNSKLKELSFGIATRSRSGEMQTAKMQKGGVGRQLSASHPTVPERGLMAQVKS